MLGVRDRIPALAGATYLDNAGAGLPPLSVTKAMNDFVADWAKHGEHWDQWLLDVLECRNLFGRLVGARKDEVGVVPNVSVGLAALASAVDFRKRRRVVTSDLNFPTNVVLWQRMREAGIVKTVELLKNRDGVVPIEDWEKAINDDTAVVAVDYASWFSGYREHVREIAELAHDHGALIFVDGFHGLGVFPIDVKLDGIDALCGGFYKWLCGPHGAACVYVNAGVLEHLEPSYIGWLGIEDNVLERVLEGRDPFDVPFQMETARPSATSARFEWGTWAAVVVKGAVEALKFAMEIDPASRFEIIGRRKRELLDGLRELGVKTLASKDERNPGSGITTFSTRDHKTLVRKLAERKIIVSGRFNHVRVAPHFYNTGDEIDALLGALKPELSGLS